MRGALAVRAEVRPPTVTALVQALKESETGKLDALDQATSTLPNAAAFQLARAASTVQPPATSRKKYIGIARR